MTIAVSAAGVTLTSGAADACCEAVVPLVDEPGAAASAVIADLDGRVGAPGADRFMAPEIEAAEEYVASGRLVRTVESAVGPLN